MEVLMKAICIYHSVDLDGWMSAAIVKHWFEYQPYNIKISENTYGRDTIDFLGWKYGDNIPNLDEYDQVIMCDIVFPKEDMLHLWATKGQNFIWLDHHKSAIDEMQNAHENISSGAYPIQGLRDTKFAACELAWKYFFPAETMPEIVRLLGRYDCFGHKNTDEETKVLEFQYGARQCISNYEEAYRYLIDEGMHFNIAPNTIDIVWEKGKSIYQYLCTEAKQSYKNGFKVWFPDYNLLGAPEHGGRGFDFICINKERFNPINFGIDYHKEGYDGVACFWYENGNWNFSLYNDNGLVDCSEIASQYGGGGHRSASGFIVKEEEFFKIINNGRTLERS